MKSKMQEYLQIRRELFAMEGAKEHGNNLFIEHVVNDRHRTTTTLGAMKIMALDEIVEIGLIDVLCNELEAIIQTSVDGKAVMKARNTLMMASRYTTPKP